jgi:nucleoid-associated protein YgaU
MNRSKTIALILGPCLVIAALVGYWVKTHLAARDAPLDLHANVAATPPAAITPPPARLLGTEPNSQAAAAPTDAPRPSASIDTAPSAAAPAPAPVAPPKFDVVRVEPSGDAVIAGHTEPNTQVAVVSNGKVIAEGKSDASGQFVFVPPPLPPGEHGLALRITPPSGPAVVSDQNVAVSVPAKGKGDVMVALAEPGKATVLMTDPLANPVANPATKTETPAPAKPADTAKPVAPPVKPQVAIKTAEIVEPGGFFATGIATPGTHLRLYLNGSALAEVTAGPDGRWSVKVGKGLVPGHYAVRADQIDAAGTVVARAEVPFDYAPAATPKETAAATPPPATAVSPTAAPVPMPSSPAKEPEKQASNRPAQEHDTPAAARSDAGEAMAKLPAEVSASSQTPQPEAANKAKTAPSDSFVASTGQSATAIIPEIQTATVEKGNSLWRISHDTLGRGTRYTEIYAANASQIRDPKLIYPGQIFVIPGQTN